MICAVLGQAGSGGREAGFQHVEEDVEDGAGPEHAGVTPQDGQRVDDGKLWGRYGGHLIEAVNCHQP